jgi:two-component system NarL family sensor kinase
VRRAVLQFAAASITALLVVGLASVAVLQRQGKADAVNDSKELTSLAARGVVQRNLSEGVLAGNQSDLVRFGDIVRASVLGTRIVRVKIWTPSGKIVYSDAPDLIGSTFPLTTDELASLRSGRVRAETATDLTQAENRLEQQYGRLLEVYVPIQAPNGQPLLFEAYLPYNEVSASAHHLWVSFAPALIGGLAVLALVQLPLAWSLARRLQRGQAEREALLTRAVEASDEERRRISRDLHDGVVQDLAGVAYSLAAAAQTARTQSRAEIDTTLREAAAQTRQSIRSLRSLLVDIYPAGLERSGLEPALSDLLARLESRNIAARLDFPSGLSLDAETEALLYRVAREAVRNVSVHSGAHNVDVVVSASDHRVALEVRDDGVGFDPASATHRPRSGHFGLRLISDLVQEHGGELEVESVPGRGTRVRVETGTA